MIDTKELRRLTQAATSGEWYVKRGNYIYGRNEVTDGKEVWYPVIAYTDDDEVNVNFEANAAFIAAANPAAISELLDRLEAAESARRDDYQNWMTALDRNAELLAKLEAAEKERDELQAKIEQMEKQEPYSYIYEYSNRIDGSPVWRDKPGYWNAQFQKSSKPLYLAPGAQPAPSVPAVPPKSLKPVIDWLRNGCDPMRAADELDLLIAAAQEAKP